MSPVWIDARGEEHQLLIAEKSLVVPDPLLGFDRQIIAGQPVPPELEDSYRSAGQKPRSERSSARKEGAGEARKGKTEDKE